MTELRLAERLRIERAVWALDARLGELPRKSRVAKRREIRANLHAAAADTGAAEAVRRLGNLRHMAAEYLAAEYEPGALRPAWGTAAAWLIASVLAAGVAVDACKSAFAAGLAASGAHSPGTYTWRGIPYFTDQATITLTDHHSATVGGAWTPLVYLLLLLVFAISARLWRLLPGFDGIRGPRPIRNPS